MKIITLSETNSTNEQARIMLNSRQISPPTVIFADFQTSGKGMAENTWQSEKGKNILCSYVLKPNIAPEKQFKISQAVALSILNFLKEFSSEFLIKWPNDIYFKNKKTAGILIENLINGQNIVHSIIGIGININQIKFPDNLLNSSSLSMVTGQKINLEYAKQSLTKHILETFEQIKYNSSMIHKEYIDNLYRYREMAEYRDSKGIFEGMITGVSKYGHLIVQNCNTHKQEEYDIKEIEFL